MNCYVKVYGCQMNQTDSELLSRLLADAGINEVESSEEADWVVLITCSVRQHAEDRASGFARSMRGQGKSVIIAGCMARLRGSQLREQGIADYVLGPDEYRRVPHLILSGEDSASSGYSETYADLLPVTAGPVSASLAVMRGCNNFCTYCVVPYARGPERSIPYPALERQASTLASQGIKELFFLGQNVLAYGWNGMGFVELLEHAARFDGVERLGFLTSHPRDVSRDMLARMSCISKLLHFFHLPLQSGSDKILEAMRRGYTFSEYEEKVGWVRELFPDAYITTDLLVGFPGESEEDFRLTMDRVNRIGFDFAYMFAYSPRPGTEAALMGYQVPAVERRGRLAELIALQNHETRKRVTRLVGGEEEVFVIAPAPRGKGAMRAALANNRSVILNKETRLGERLRARLVGVEGRTLLAESVGKEM